MGSVRSDSRRQAQERRTQDDMRILHVTEAFGGGAAYAAAQFATSHRQVAGTGVRHHLVFGTRRELLPGDPVLEAFDGVVAAGTGPAVLTRALRSCLLRWRPDVLHCHSSWAGFVARSIQTTVPVVYTPHCFYFERTTLPRSVRAAARATERMLAGRTAVAACVSPRERDLCDALGMDAVYVPNIVDLAPVEEKTALAAGAPVHVVSVGRVAPQKDPSFFAAAVAGLRRRLPGRTIRAEWIGGGDAGLVRELAGRDIGVTGWLSRTETLDRMRAADLYLHTAAWEGSPVSLLEASAIGLPVVTRRIPALVSLGLDDGAETPDSMAELAERFVRGTWTAKIPRVHSVSEQAEALAQVYTRATTSR